MKGIGRTIKRRRMEAKTDYKARIGMLKSNQARVVVRKTNKYITGQIVSSDVANDKVVLSVSSKELLDRGWPLDMSGSLKNLTACYLTGFLLGKRTNKIKRGILDIGLQRNVANSRLNAFLKGIVDSGFEIPHDEKSLLNEEAFNKDEKTKNILNKLREEMK